jgi:hypothetical protein
VRSQDRPGGGVELAVDDGAGRGPRDQVDEHVDVDDDPAHHTVGVGGAAGDRVVAKQPGEPRDPVDRAAGPLGAGRAAAAGESEGTPQRPVGVGVPRVGAADEVRRVEDQGPQPLRVVHGEGLGEERAVGVAVEVDLVDAE